MQKGWCCDLIGFVVLRGFVSSWSRAGFLSSVGGEKVVLIFLRVSLVFFVVSGPGSGSCQVCRESGGVDDLLRGPFVLFVYFVAGRVLDPK